MNIEPIVREDASPGKINEVVRLGIRMQKFVTSNWRKGQDPLATLIQFRMMGQQVFGNVAFTCSNERCKMVFIVNRKPVPVT